MDNENIKKEIKDIGLSTRSYFLLWNKYINTVGELATKTEADLLKIRGFGKKSLKEVKDVLRCMGLELRPPARPPRRPRPDTEVVRAADRFVTALATALEHYADDPDSVGRLEAELVRAVHNWRKSR